MINPIAILFSLHLVLSLVNEERLLLCLLFLRYGMWKAFA